MFFWGKSNVLTEKENNHPVTEELVMKNLAAIQKEVEDPPDYDYVFEYGSDKEYFHAMVK
jgi:hypothetical protein